MCKNEGKMAQKTKGKKIFNLLGILPIAVVMLTAVLTFASKADATPKIADLVSPSSLSDWEIITNGTLEGDANQFDTDVTGDGLAPNLDPDPVTNLALWAQINLTSPSAGAQSSYLSDLENLFSDNKEVTIDGFLTDTGRPIPNYFQTNGSTELEDTTIFQHIGSDLQGSESLVIIPDKTNTLGFASINGETIKVNNRGRIQQLVTFAQNDYLEVNALGVVEKGDLGDDSDVVFLNAVSTVSQALGGGNGADTFVISGSGQTIGALTGQTIGVETDTGESLVEALTDTENTLIFFNHIDGIAKTLRDNPATILLGNLDPSGLQNSYLGFSKINVDTSEVIFTGETTSDLYNRQFNILNGSRIEFADGFKSNDSASLFGDETDNTIRFTGGEFNGQTFDLDDGDDTVIFDEGEFIEINFGDGDDFFIIEADNFFNSGLPGNDENNSDEDNPSNNDEDGRAIGDDGIDMVIFSELSENATFEELRQLRDDIEKFNTDFEFEEFEWLVAGEADGNCIHFSSEDTPEGRSTNGCNLVEEDETDSGDSGDNTDDDNETDENGNSTDTGDGSNTGDPEGEGTGGGTGGTGGTGTVDESGLLGDDSGLASILNGLGGLGGGSGSGGSGSNNNDSGNDSTSTARQQCEGQSVLNGEFVYSDFSDTCLLVCNSTSEGVETAPVGNSECVEVQSCTEGQVIDENGACVDSIGNADIDEDGDDDSSDDSSTECEANEILTTVTTTDGDTVSICVEERVDNVDDTTTDSGLIDSTITTAGDIDLTTDITSQNNNDIVQDNNTAQADDDFIDIAISPDATISADTITASDNDDQIINQGTINADVVLGDGDDEFNLSQDGVVSDTILGGAGNDIITLDDEASANDDIFLGAGNDILNILDNSSALADIDGEGGNDSILISGNATVGGNIKLGEDNDIITFEGNGSADGSIDGEDGSDRIIFGMGLNQIRNVSNEINNFEILSVTGDGELILDNDYSFNQTLISNDGKLTVADDRTLFSDVIGDNTNNQLTVKGTVDGDVALNGGDDRLLIDFDAGGNITGTADGGDGVDSVGFSSATSQTINGAPNGFTNFEGLAVGGGARFTLIGSNSTVSALTISDKDTELLISQGASYNATVNGDSTRNKLTVEGDLTGNVDLGNGSDEFTVNLDTGSYNGTARGGEGVLDIANIEANSSSTNFNLSNLREFEKINFDGNSIFNLTGSNDTDLNLIALNDRGGLILAPGANINADINGSDQSNSIDIQGSYNGSLDLKGGDDSLVYNLDNNSNITGTIEGGAGTDNITFTSSGSRTLDRAISGFETATLSGGGLMTLARDYDFENLTINSGTGILLNDSIDINIINSINADAGDNSIFLGRDSTLATGTINTGAGDDFISIADGATLDTSNLDLSDGDDFVIVTSTNNITGLVNGGSGNDTALFDTTGTMVIDTAKMSNFEILEVANGNFGSAGNNINFDRVNVTDGANFVFQAGSTNNIDVFGDDNGVGIIYEGTNAGDTITGSGDDIIGLTGTHTGNITTGFGNDRIASDNATFTGVVNLGEGDNSIEGNIINSGELINPNELDVNGNYTQTNSGKFTSNALVALPVGNNVGFIDFNKLNVAGNAIIDGVIEIQNLTSSDLQYLNAGDAITVASASGSMTDSGVIINGPAITNDLYGWNTAVNGSDLDLEYLYARADCANFEGLDADAKALCNAISEASSDGSTYSDDEVQALLMAMNNGAGNTQMNYLDSMGAGGFVGTNQSISRAVTQFHNIAHDRIFASDMADRISAQYANVQNGGRNQIFQNFGCGAYGGFLVNSSSAGDGRDAYSASSNGVYLGGECANDEMKVGLTAGYQTSDLDGDYNYTSASNILSIGAYGTMDTSDGVKLAASANFHSASSDTTRTLVAGSESGTASGDFGTFVFSAKGEAGYDLKKGDLLLRPFGGLEYQMLSSDGVSETGTGITDLMVEDYSSSRALFNVGGRAVMDKIWADKMMMASPYAEVELVADLLSLDNAIGATILDENFNSTGAEEASTRFKLGVGFDGSMFGKSGLNQHNIFGHLKYETGIDASSSDSSLRLGYKYNF